MKEELEEGSASSKHSTNWSHCCRNAIMSTDVKTHEQRTSANGINCRSTWTTMRRLPWIPGSSKMLPYFMEKFATLLAQPSV